MADDSKKLAEQVGLALKQRGLKLVTAESCTGGGLSYIITEIPGSSEWFERGFVTYSDVSKTEMLSIDSLIIKEYGAVSEQVAREMSEGALRNSHGNVSIAITGIAGPAGGSADKPVGTVWIAWTVQNKTQANRYQFSGDRQNVRLQTIRTALDKLLDLL